MTEGTFSPFFADLCFLSLLTVQVTETVRTGNADARDFIRRSVLDAWQRPFAGYTKPMSQKAKSRATRQAAGGAADSSSSASSKPASAVAPPAPAAPTTPPRRLINHFVMNLPAMAIEFLDAFKGLYRPLYELAGDEAREAVRAAGSLPLVHCYCFTKDMEDQEGDVLRVRIVLRSLQRSRRRADDGHQLLTRSEPQRRLDCQLPRISRITICDSCATWRPRRRCIV